MVAAEATSLRRGIAILFALEQADTGGGDGMGVSQIAKVVGREKSQVSRSLKVLAQYGLVDRDAESLEYRLGWRLFTMAGRAGDAQLLAAAMPVLKRLVRGLDETVHLSLLQGAEVMTILSESPNRAVQASGWIGRTVPAYCTSSGRALLFDHELSDLLELLGGVRFDCPGPNTPSGVEQLAQRVAAARRRGFAVVDEEFELGLVAAGAPVRNFRGSVVAALNVSGPKFRLADRLEAAGLAVKTAADQVSVHLGWPSVEGRKSA
ncbi:MAG: IclR family transcriptional regulator [Gaiellaceae bacterium]